ncbi:4'-phosphopantetheinyl transferase family protein [Cellulomonas composti]|uniref:4'-phosphopantetheinyl transferase n=1 Tax=Cellulomonas composti TaxID=266130 RepID=A0A511JCC8_9CELL|nr:4'-phosphopantetheinyl transferase superfamily protein [Cellulomonas composti]GEL95632.1 4'-phosphopantetheinyl transferase [Cellulomonas composti]
MLADLVPLGIEVVERHGPPVTVPLFADEEASVADAVPARRAEYAAVRGCAREALTRLGVGPVAVPSAPDRAPVWPAGTVGAMTHCVGYRAAAVGRADDWAGLGIDAEPLAPLPSEVAELVLSDHERAPLADLDPAWCADRVLFSVKECVYKVWSPITGVWLGFEDVHVRLEDGHFVAQLRRPELGVDELHGRWTAHDGLILTALALPRRARHT